MHEGDPTGGETSLHDEGIEGGDEHLGDGCGITQGDARGYPQGLSFVHHESIGIGAAAHDAHDLVTDGERGHTVPDLDHPTGELHPRDLRSRRGVPGQGRTRIQPPTLQQIGAVEGGGHDLHDHLLGIGDRIGHLRDPQDPGIAVLGQDNCAHRHSSSPRIVTPGHSGREPTIGST